MEGWIKLHRRFLLWEWFQDQNMVHLFIYLILKANHKDGNWKGNEIKRGQLVTGLYTMNKETGISIQSIRTCLTRLEKTGEINKQSNNKLTTITICNYDSYQYEQQATNKQTNKPVTNEQQTTNNKQECKEEKECEEVYRKFKHLSISIKEKDKLLDSGFNLNQIDSIMDSIENYRANKKYTSLYLTSLNWLKKEYGEKVEGWDVKKEDQSDFSDYEKT